MANLAGVGAAIWGETITDFADLTFMLLPRLAGMAEKRWSAARHPSWVDHCARLAAHGRLWTQDGLTYFKSSTVNWTLAESPPLSARQRMSARGT